LVASANVEFVRSIYAAWERGDYSSAEWADPEIEYVFADGLSPGRWRGLAEMAEGMRDFLSAWKDFHSEAEEYLELDAERVLVLAHWRGRGKMSRVELGRLRTKSASLFHIRAGRVTRLVLYVDGERALADLGLSSKSRSTGS
jgi:ketosteroid isomerase-like protein